MELFKFSLRKKYKNKKIFLVRILQSFFCSVNLRIQIKYSKISTRKNPYFDTFWEVFISFTNIVTDTKVLNKAYLMLRLQIYPKEIP